MNTITFALVPFDADADQDYLVVHTLIDNVPLANFERFATDLHAVEESIANAGPLFLLTCWCGIPECAGLHHGITVFHDGPIIRWRVPAPLAERGLLFDRTQYVSAYQACLTKGKRRISNRHYTTTKPFSITPASNRKYFPLDQA